MVDQIWAHRGEPVRKGLRVERRDRIRTEEPSSSGCGAGAGVGVASDFVGVGGGGARVERRRLDGGGAGLEQSCCMRQPTIVLPEVYALPLQHRPPSMLVNALARVHTDPLQYGLPVDDDERRRLDGGLGGDGARRRLDGGGGGGQSSIMPTQ